MKSSKMYKDKINQTKSFKVSLKNFFIPDHGNDFHPHSLKLKRIFGHFSVAVVLKIILLVFAVFLPLTAWLSPDFYLEKEALFLQKINQIRYENDLPELIYNEKLYLAAKNKVQDMFYEQYFSHISPKGEYFSKWIDQINFDYSKVGENLAIGSSDVEKVVAKWQSSQTHNQNILDKGFSQTGIALASGEFNNKQTFIVAQFFAEPNELNSKILDNYKQNDDIIQPTIVNFDKIDLANSNVVALEILAPQAEKIILLNNDLVVAEKIKKTDDDLVEIVVNFEPADYNLKIASVVQNGINYSGEYVLNLPKNKVVLNSDQTKIIVDKPAGEDYQIVKTVANLASNIVEAEVVLGEQIIKMEPSTDVPNKWVGYKVIDNKYKFDDPLILGTLITKDSFGAIAKQDINIDNFEITQSNWFNKYLLYKKYPTVEFNNILYFVNLYIKFLIGFFAIALLLKIFINIKRQHVHVIVSSLGVIILLIMFLII